MSGRIRNFTKGYASLPNALNTPIQGIAADITKLALINLLPKLRSTQAQIMACIHDEILLEVEAGQAEAAKVALEQAMISAGERYLIVVEATIADSWAAK